MNDLPDVVFESGSLGVLKGAVNRRLHYSDVFFSNETDTNSSNLCKFMLSRLPILYMNCYSVIAYVPS